MNFTLRLICFLITWTASALLDTSENGAVGLATPSLTGAIKASAVSHSSSMAKVIKAWKTLLHIIRGWAFALKRKIHNIYIVLLLLIILHCMYFN